MTDGDGIERLLADVSALRAAFARGQRRNRVLLALGSGIAALLALPVWLWALGAPGFIVKTYNGSTDLPRFTIESGDPVARVYFQDSAVGIDNTVPGAALHIGRATSALGGPGILLEDSGGIIPNKITRAAAGSVFGGAASNADAWHTHSAAAGGRRVVRYYSDLLASEDISSTTATDRQAGTLTTVALPAGATVKQAVLWWEGTVVSTAGSFANSTALGGNVALQKDGGGYTNFLALNGRMELGYDPSGIFVQITENDVTSIVTGNGVYAAKLSSLSFNTDHAAWAFGRWVLEIEYE